MHDEIISNRKWREDAKEDHLTLDINSLMLIFQTDASGEHCKISEKHSKCISDLDSQFFIQLQIKS